ncbi:phosphate ABC transporter permease subunit PstC [Rubrivirga marina]|uniref:Phosphate transport system permease protein n=1 Tax=Rubrivirga marina TaxID=1196024 RepID=A0A271J320_9BACT|nr:phosphate ABC transporter permease subunit PstC [Rubrivirga marina]PAP77109.1 phosphate ABC transporter permease subunit PstC [Rubrivirga marina]
MTDLALGHGAEAVPSAAPTFEGNVSRSATERTVGALLSACALVTVATTLGIVAVLVWETVAFFGQVSPVEFFTATEWTPLFVDGQFGVWPLVTGTLLITVIAAVVALPLGLLAAVYVSQFARAGVRRVVKPALELLAGIPTVVYGYFALTFVTPLLQAVVPGLGVYNALSAGLVVGIMILPLVASLSEDALRAVPRRLSEGAYALGATEGEVVWQVTIPAALSGIVASFILALGRAVGETMIVVLAAGATPALTLDPRESVLTMTSFIVNATLGDAAQGSAVFQSLFAVGLLLFLITLAMNVGAQRVVRRFAEKA